MLYYMFVCTSYTANTGRARRLLGYGLDKGKAEEEKAGQGVKRAEVFGIEHRGHGNGKRFEPWMHALRVCQVSRPPDAGRIPLPPVAGLLRALDRWASAHDCLCRRGYVGTTPHSAAPAGPFRASESLHDAAVYAYCIASCPSRPAQRPHSHGFCLPLPRPVAFGVYVPFLHLALSFPGTVVMLCAQRHCPWLLFPQPRANDKRLMHQSTYPPCQPRRHGDSAELRKRPVLGLTGVAA